MNFTEFKNHRNPGIQPYYKLFPTYFDIFGFIKFPFLISFIWIGSKVEMYLVSILLYACSTCCFNSFLIFVLNERTWIGNTCFFFIKVQQATVIYFSAIWSRLHCNCKTKWIRFFFFWFIWFSRTRQGSTKYSSFCCFIWIAMLNYLLVKPNLDLKWGVSSQWSFYPNSAYSSI